MATKAKAISRQALFGIGPVVSTDTLLRWYRTLVARKYDGSKARKAGRPKTKLDIEQLVMQMAWENASWGCTRFRGALRNLGDEIGRNTIKRILLANGIQPAAIRRKGMSWETFLKSHWGVIAAIEFFNVEVLTSVGLITEYTEHDLLERNHQGLGNELIERPAGEAHGRVHCRERLGGVLRYYDRRAA